MVTRDACRRYVMARALLLFLLLTCFVNFPPAAWSQTTKRVVLQGFWWDYWNNNYPFAWANYLTDLAPRLRELGIDAVWIPPSVKNEGGPTAVGYAPFDHYDLGDKFQKGDVRTRLGTKDELLRMAAVMHANGIEVVQDIVFNHIIGANVRDPLAQDDQYKIFRYTSFATPQTVGDSVDYIGRRGRFPKNWINFHPNPWRGFGGNPGSSLNDVTSAFFGPDICFDPRAYGQSSLPTGNPLVYNPPQSLNYMRNELRRWFIWHTKQIGIDGYRFDAVKHFEPHVVHDVVWHVASSSGDITQGVNGSPALGWDILSIGEWVGGKTELDEWAGAPPAPESVLEGGLSSTGRNLGGVDNRAGTFDFGLRGFSTDGLVGMVYGFGAFDMSTIPSLQQDNRGRTVPFVNNHDTFRPPLQPNGDYPVGTWTSSSELGRNIDPREPRLAVAYAIILSVDGSPQIFFEDLFDIGSGGIRYTHIPSNPASLPVRDDIANLIRCHQKLQFKSGAYFVRTAETGDDAPFFQQGNLQDGLVFERGGRAMIGVTDSWDTEQRVWVTTTFPVGTVLKDYGGTYGFTVTVQPPSGSSGNRVLIHIPPCDLTAPITGPAGPTRRRGYAVWAPVSEQANFDAPFSPTPKTITQEWEMADDLGDSHPRSLLQGGALPSNSTAWRTVGNIFPEAGQPINLRVFQTHTSLQDVTIAVFHNQTLVFSANGATNLNVNFTPTTTDWHTIRVRNTSVNAVGQRVYVRATYRAPQVVNTANFPMPYSPGRVAVKRLSDSQFEFTIEGAATLNRGVVKQNSAPSSPTDGTIFDNLQPNTAQTVSVTPLSLNYISAWGKTSSTFSLDSATVAIQLVPASGGATVPIPANTVGTFVAAAPNNRQATVIFTQPSNDAGQLIFNMQNALPLNPNNGLPLTGISPKGTVVVKNIAPRYWQITPSGLNGYQYDIELDISGLSGIADPRSVVVLKRSNSSEPWTSAANGTSVTISYPRQNVLRVSGLTSFSEFAIGGDFSTYSFLSTPPTLDGVISPGEYGDHTNGANRWNDGSRDWYMAWDDNNLYIAVDANGNANTDELAIYIDTDPQTPANGGSNANGALGGIGNFDGNNYGRLPFRANFAAFIRNEYHQHRTHNGSGGWNANVDNSASIQKTTSGNVQEIAIAWSLMGGRPQAFRAFFYLNGTDPYGGLSRFTLDNDFSDKLNLTGRLYFDIENTNDGTSTPPFSRFCYINQRASDNINDYGTTFFDATTADNQTTTIAADLTIQNSLRTEGGCQLTVSGDRTITMTGADGAIVNNGFMNANPSFGNTMNFTINGTTTLSGSTGHVDVWNLTVSSGGTLRVINANLRTGNTGTITVNGTIEFGETRFLTSYGGTANFSLNSGATLITAHEKGVNGDNPSSFNGSIRANGTVTYDAAASYVFNRPGAQITGFAAQGTLPAITTANRVATAGSGTKTLDASAMTLTASVSQPALSLGSGTTLSIGALNVEVRGNITGTGSALATTGKILIQNAPATVQVSGATFTTLELNDADGATLTGSPTILNELRLNEGTLNTGPHLVSVANPATTAVQRTNGFINNRLAREFDNSSVGARLYPLGDATTYRPISLSGATVSGNTTLRGALISASGNFTGVSSPLVKVSDLRYYEFRNTGTNSLSISQVVDMAINSDDAVLQVPNNTTLKIATRTTGNWQSQGPGSVNTSSLPLLTGFNSATFLTNLNANDDFFVALGTESALDNPLPVSLSSFAAKPIGRRVELVWRTESELNNAGFIIVRNDSPIADYREHPQLRGLGTAATGKVYTFIDETAAPNQVHRYQLRSVDYDGTIHDCPLTVEVNLDVPDTYSLMQNYPNPFNPETTLRYQLPEASSVKLEVYDVLGRKVATLVDAKQEAGRYTVRFNAAAYGLASGIYFYRLSAGKFVETKKMLLQK